MRTAGSNEPALTYLEVLDDEYWALAGREPDGEATAVREAYVRAALIPGDPPPDAARLRFRNDVLRRLHQAKRSALCFSGGGIRSATFGLGVLQALAATAPAAEPRRSVLGAFDYLSTVSGGGYLGSWFSAWATRRSTPTASATTGAAETPPLDGPADVIRTLAGTHPADFEPEPKPLRHLREYSNYLTPQVGITSGDTWAATGAVVRNLFLNWIVLLPLLAAVLLVPVGANAVLGLRASPAFLWVLVIGAFCLGALGTGYVGYDLPSAGDAKNRYVWFVWLSLVPLVLAAVGINTFWRLLPEGRPDASWWNVVALGRPGISWWHVGVFGALMHAGGMFMGIGMAKWRLNRPPRRTGLYASAAAALTGLAGGALAFMLTRSATGTDLPPEDHRAYTTLAFTAVMGVFLFGGTLLVGITSYFTADKDREWWARAGGIALLLTVAWPLFASLVLFAPEILDRLRVGLAELAVGAGLTGWGVAKLGGSAKTSPVDDRPARAAPVPRWTREVLAHLALPIFVVLLVLLIAAANIHLGTGLASWMAGTPSGAGGPQLPAVLILVALYAAVSLGASFFINVNAFSLHAMYRQRLVRCYLGASNEAREPHPFTGFDEHDNMPMCTLTPHRPMHVVNMALNLVGGARLAWQHRKAESFTVSRLHAGSWCTGYRRSTEYGGKDRTAMPITLGTAMTISGAAASPNMGYHSSPLLTLVMTLFNARLGWWLGNPRNEDGLWRHPGPRFGVRPFVDEALGLTTDDNAWVYLSDGGHFDNLGLYEMVLRRCHTIVLCDAGADPRFHYEDLGNAVRKIRIDLGVPIVFDTAMPKPRPAVGTAPTPGPRCAVARIVYSAFDTGAADGVLVYVKPTLLGGEPADVAHYASHDPVFPHQATTDQFFDEAQFESYRRLGAHTVESIWATPQPEGLASATGLAAFVARARAAAIS